MSRYTLATLPFIALAVAAPALNARQAPENPGANFPGAPANPTNLSTGTATSAPFPAGPGVSSAAIAGTEGFAPAPTAPRVSSAAIAGTEGSASAPADPLVSAPASSEMAVSAPDAVEPAATSGPANAAVTGINANVSADAGTAEGGAAGGDSEGASGGAGGGAYTMFEGDGSTGAGWPDENDWLPFEDMWTANTNLMSASCAQFGVDNNSEDETHAIRTAIEEVGGSSGIPSQFLLAIVVQESKGCVRAPTTIPPGTDGSIQNRGLMQSGSGSGSCGDPDTLNPCPNDQITQMIKDGATDAPGMNFKTAIAQAASPGGQQYYKAARIFNSGSEDASGDLGAEGATRCYASDIANRLIGYVDAPTGCTLGA